MMRDIAMHVSDLLENSVNAGGNVVELSIKINTRRNKMRVIIADNGKGMDETKAASVFDPFVTSRTTRRVGLGLPLIKQTAEACEGKARIFSSPGKGTILYFSLAYNHIDRPPMGDLVFSVLTFLRGNKNIDFYYEHCYNKECFKISSNEIKKEIEDMDLLDNHDVYHFLKEYMEEGLTLIYGGMDNEIIS